MFFLYNILLHLVFIILFPYFIFKSIVTGKYRKNFFSRLGFWTDTGNEGFEKKVWFHSVSVGETRAVIPLLKKFKEKNPKTKIYFSTVTLTGNEVAGKEGEGLIDCLFYLPFDFSWVVKKVVNKIGPDVFIIVEKEIWPNILKTLNKKEIPIAVINGIVSERSFRKYLKLNFFFKKVFSMINVFLSVTGEDAKRAIMLGVDEKHVLVAGNIKFEMDFDVNKEEIEKIKKELFINDTDIIFTAGSTHKGEEEIILNLFNELKDRYENLKLVIAPRHPQRFSEVEKLINDNKLKCIKRKEAVGSKEDKKEERIILLNTIGELTKIYSFSDFCFVGGSMVEGIGGHNIMEPAFFEKPAIYGHHIKSYEYMANMLEKGAGGVRACNIEELKNMVKSFLDTPSLAVKIGESGKRVVEQNKGAMGTTISLIEKLTNIEK